MDVGFKSFVFSHGSGNIAGSWTCCARVQAQGGSRILQSLASRRKVLRKTGPLQILQATSYWSFGISVSHAYLVPHSSKIIVVYCVHRLNVNQGIRSNKKAGFSEMLCNPFCTDEEIVTWDLHLKSSVVVEALFN